MIGRLREGLLARRGLVALCVGLNLAEAGVVAALGPRSGLSLAPQASAVVPFGVFDDLRWLVVYSNSWPAVVGEGVTMLALRSAITALSVRMAWPGGAGSEAAPVPGFLSCWGRAVAFTAAAAALLAPMAVLLFGLAVAPVSWFFFAAVPAALIVALLFHHGAVGPGWWRQGMSLRAMGWVLGGFVVATVSGAVIAAVPTAWAPVVAAAAGPANALAWCGLVKAVVELGDRRAFRPVAPLALMGFAGVVVGGTVLGFAVVAPPRTVGLPTAAGGTVATALDAAQLATTGGPRVAVLVVGGYGTRWDGASPPGLPGPYLERTFSYRGLGPRGQPLPYTSNDTNQPVVAIERLMAAQVRALHRTSHDPVAIVAESEGSLVAKAYLAASPGAPVRYLVMTSPLVRPGRVYYPPAGSQGWGLAGGKGLAGIADAVRSLAPIPLSPTSPFLRSVLDEPATLGPLLSCPLPGVNQAAVLPLADAVASPAGHPVGVPSVVLAAFHGGMLTNPAADRAIASLLKGTGLPDTPTLAAADALIRSAASAWQVPSLVAPLGPRTGTRAPLKASTCPAIGAALAAQLASQPRG